MPLLYYRRQWNICAVLIAIYSGPDAYGATGWRCCSRLSPGLYLPFKFLLSNGGIGLKLRYFV
jgi:hypothetical protein